MKRLHTRTLLEGYYAENIWNKIEPHCFLCALPTTLADKRRNVNEKSKKQQLTIVSSVSAGDGKEVPSVIGQAAKPRCFSRISDKSMPHGITSYSNPKAWTTSGIIEDVLATIERRMVRQERRILIFVDNVSSQLPSLVDNFSNINILFFTLIL